MFKKKRTYIILAAITVVVFLILNRAHKDVSREVVTTEIREYIDKPFANVSIPRKYYDVDAAAGAVLMYATTRISVPQCAFLDSTGSVVEGNVKLSYREVNDPASIIISGVPMAIAEDSSDYLQSAGMLEILAWTDGVQLKVNEECQINIEKRSGIGAGDYNMYNLDTINRRWDLKQENIAAKPLVQQPENAIYKKPDYELMALKAGIVKPVKPVEKEKDKFQFQFKMDFSDNPEINIYNGVQWEFAGKKGREDPSKNPWVLSAVWKEMEIVRKYKNGTYKLRLSSGKREFTTIVKPVFAGDDMDYAEYVYNDKYEAYRKYVAKKKEEARILKKKQEELAKAREKQRKASALAGEFTRVITVMGFGWVNIDKLLNDDRQEIALSLVYKNGDSVNVSRVFLLTESVNSVASFYQRTLPQFWFPKQRKNQLVVIDAESQAYIIKPAAFAAIRSNATEHTFRISEAGRKIKSVDDLQAML
jgi:hypothetical protein